MAGAVVGLVAGALTVVPVAEVACVVSAAVAATPDEHCTTPDGPGEASAHGPPDGRDGSYGPARPQPRQPVRPVVRLDPATTVVAAPSVPGPPACDPDPAAVTGSCAADGRAQLRGLAAALRNALEGAGVCPQVWAAPLPALELRLVDDGSGPAEVHLANHPESPDGSTTGLSALRPSDDPALVAAVGVYLARTLGAWAQTPGSAGHEAFNDGLAWALAGPVAAIDSALLRADIAGTPPDCAAVHRSLSELGTARLPRVSSYVDVCLVDPATAAGGVCPRGLWASVGVVPRPVPGETTVTLPGDLPAVLGPDAASAGTTPGVVPGVPYATRQQVRAHCTADPQACRTALDARRTRTLESAYSFFERIGACATRSECQAVVTSFGPLVAGGATPGRGLLPERTRLVLALAGVASLHVGLRVATQYAVTELPWPWNAVAGAGLTGVAMLLAPRAADLATEEMVTALMVDPDLTVLGVDSDRIATWIGGLRYPLGDPGALVRAVRNAVAQVDGALAAAGGRP